MHPLGICLLLQQKPQIDLIFLPAGPEVLDQATSNEVREPGHDVGFSLGKTF
jgi:hypothetical protein